MRALAFGVALLAALATTSAQAATRAYLMKGLAGWLFTPVAMEQIGARLRGATVTTGSWLMWATFARDACAHRSDRIIIIGHSFGAIAAADMANAVRACGVRNVTVVPIDPPPNLRRVEGVRGVAFIGALGGTIDGIKNVPARGFNHLNIVTDRAMQARIVSSALAH